MFHTTNGLHGHTLVASDGELGRVDECYFDDETWTVRYLVVDTGGWLGGRKVLVSPYSVRRCDADARTVEVSLTREQVEKSPAIDTHKPVSRQHEVEYLQYYGYPAYWGGTELWGLGALPAAPAAGEAAARQAESSGDSHLRSSKDVTGYHIQASDERFGHVEDFVLDGDSWAIRYLVIDTRNWWPGSKRVLVATKWIDRIDWADATVHTALSKEAIQGAPAYDADAVLDRDYETRLHESHGRQGYWV